jgi:hypothetical protein
MVEHICELCNKKFNKKSNYVRHINRKNKCKNLDRTNINKKNLKYIKENEKIDCEYCNNKINKRLRYKHYIHYCKKIPNNKKLEIIEKHNKNHNTKNKININIDLNYINDKEEKQIYIPNVKSKKSIIEQNLKNINDNKYFNKIKNIGSEVNCVFSYLNNTKYKIANLDIYNTIIDNLNISKFEANKPKQNIYIFLYEIFIKINNEKHAKNFAITNVSKMTIVAKSNISTSNNNVIYDIQLKQLIYIKLKDILNFLIELKNIDNYNTKKNIIVNNVKVKLDIIDEIDNKEVENKDILDNTLDKLNNTIDKIDNKNILDNYEKDINKIDNFKNFIFYINNDTNNKNIDYYYDNTEKIKHLSLIGNTNLELIEMNYKKILNFKYSESLKLYNKLKSFLLNQNKDNKTFFKNILGII